MKFSEFLHRMRITRNSGLLIEEMDRPWFKFSFKQIDGTFGNQIFATGYRLDEYSGKTSVLYSYGEDPLGYRVWTPHNGVFVDSIRMNPRVGMTMFLREMRSISD